MNTSPAQDWLSLHTEIEARVAEARRLRSEAMGEIFVLAGRKLAALVKGAVRAVIAWRERAALADELYAMNDHQLSDIGLNRCDIDAVVSGGYRSRRGLRHRLRLIDNGVRRIKVDRVTAVKAA